MIHYDDVNLKENMKVSNSNWLQIPDYPYRTLITKYFYYFYHTILFPSTKRFD